MPYGGTEDLLDTVIDSLPPFDRIEVLRPFSRLVGRASAHAYAERIGPHPSIRKYTQNIVGNMYLEIELFEIFFRFAYKKNLEHESDIKSAIELINYLRQYSSGHFDHSLEFFSARNLLDWFDVFRTEASFRLDLDVPNSRAWKNDGTKPPPGTLLSFETGTWTRLLSNRCNRLILTGYENIDL